MSQSVAGSGFRLIVGSLVYIANEPARKDLKLKIVRHISKSSIDEIAMKKRNQRNKSSGLGNLEFYHLEDRRCLAGVTVITHGWQPVGGQGANAPIWAIEMGTSVLGRAMEEGSSGPGSIFIHDTRVDQPTFGEWVPLNSFNIANNTWQNSNNPNDEVVLIYNWVWDSNDGEDGWIQAAADNLFASLVQKQTDENRFGNDLVGRSFADLALSASSENVYDFHFIGHSRGAVLNSLVTNTFGHHFPLYDIDQVTSLDPHPIEAGFISGRIYDSSDPPIYTYANVIHADNYFREDGLFPLGYQLDGDFNGIPVTGAWDIQLKESVLNLGGHIQEHSDVHLWYRATIDTDRYIWDSGDIAITETMQTSWWNNSVFVNSISEVSFGRENIGYARSRIGKESRAKFHALGNEPRHEIVGPSESIFNGDFRYGDSVLSEVPGWERHGGGGAGYVATQVFPNFGGRFLSLSNWGASRTHNWMYVPTEAESLQFDFQRFLANSNDRLRVILGNVGIGTIEMNTRDPDWITGGQLIIPEILRGTVQTLIFQLVSSDGSVGSQIYLDNISFAGPVADPIANLGGPYNVPEGGTVILNGSASLSSHPTNANLEFLWDLDDDGRFGETGVDARRGDEVGAAPLFKSLGQEDDDETTPTRPIRLQVKASGVTSPVVSTIVYIDNAPPNVLLTGPSNLAANQSGTYHAFVSDPSFLDVIRPEDINWYVRVGNDVFQGTGSVFTFTPLVNAQFDIRVTVNDDDDGVTVKTMVVNLDFSQAIIGQLDRRIDGNLAGDNDTDLYLLEGLAGQKITVSAYWGASTQQANVLRRIRLLDASGTILAEPGIDTSHPGLWHYSSRISDFNLPVDGAYYVEVFEIGGGPGAYFLGISDPLTNWENLPLTGQTDADFGVFGDTQHWQFTATAGQAIGWTYQGSLSIKNLRILGPGGNVIWSAAGGNNIQTFAFTPTQSGLHRIVFETVNSTTVFTSDSSIGPFNYTMTPAVSGFVDRRIDGNLAGDNDTDLYLLEGLAGQKITVSAYWGASTQQANVLRRIRLLDASGTILAEPGIDTSHPGLWHYSSRISDFNLPVDGAYYVEVFEIGGGPGAYFLGISDPLTNWENLPLTGQTDADFGVFGDTQHWQFTATAGQAIGWTYQGSLSIKNLRILGPGGNVIWSAAGGNNIQTFAFTPTQSGLHRIVFETVNSTTVFTSGSSIGPFSYTMTPAEVEPPRSYVNQLPRNAASLDFQVFVTAIDPVGFNNVAPSGVATIDIFVAAGNGAFQYWTTVPASNPTAIFHATSNQIYWFYSIAKDVRGNVEVKAPTAEAKIAVADFDKPVTSVVWATSNEDGLFKLQATGTDVGGSNIKIFEFYVVVDGGQPKLIASTSAGSPVNGIQGASAKYQGLVDNTEHNYVFYTVGIDSRGNIEDRPVDTNADIRLVRTFFTAPTAATGIDVQLGSQQRSYVRYLDLTFNRLDQLQSLIDNGRIRIERFSLLDGNSIPGTGTLVQATGFTIIGSTIRLDFGAGGIGGNASSNVGNGFYRVYVDSNQDGNFDDQEFGFFRIFGDVTGDGVVNSADTALVLSQFGQTGDRLEGDTNGDGVVNILDRVFTMRQSGTYLHSDLFDDLDD